jgi:hypothetical protein
MDVSMRHGWRVLLAAGLLLATAGCGGAGSGASTAGPSLAVDATPAPGASTGAPATDAAPTDAEATDPAASTDAAAGGGGSAGGVCDLVTSAELGQALGSDGITTTLVAGPPDTCAFASADDTPLGAMVLLTSGGGVVYQAIHQGSTITDFSGIGDQAFYSSEMQTLSVLKGDALLTISVVSATSDEQRRDLEKAIAAAAAPRM